MSGGKETPRQKMIGMMYLVLTALLALQVSSAVLEKFAIINVTLDELKGEGDRKNNEFLGALVKAGTGKTDPKVVTAVGNAQKVREATDKTMKEIEAVKLKMLGLSHTDKVDGKFINDHGSQVATLMMDPNSPVGKAFEKTLNDYVKEISDLSGEKFAPLAKAPKDIAFFADDPDHNKKDFLTFTFENTPPIAALASVTQIQTEVLDYESKALTTLSKSIDVGVKFDKIVPMVIPEASVVAAGSKYKASLMIAASAEGLVPEMFRNGQKIEVAPDPVTKIMMGKVEFTASGGNYDKDGVSKQKFSAKIKIGEGPDKEFNSEIEYIVIKPTIKVTTGNRPTLYMNCGNNVTFEVPALGTNYNPSFTAKGAELVKGPKLGNEIIIPKERKVEITVSNAGANLGTETFDVKLIPKPRYVAKNGQGKEIDLRTGEKATNLGSLRVSAEPDENFKNEVPADANYRVRSMDVILARGTSPIKRETFTNENMDLAAWRALMKPGDNLVVDIKTATRRTYQNLEEKVEIRTEIIRIPIIN
ncbi:MAG: gliding motility protein GldM [Bacteroidota bacterium]